MSWFDWVCIAVLILFVGGYVWVKVTDKMAPPADADEKK